MFLPLAAVHRVVAQYASRRSEKWGCDRLVARNCQTEIRRIPRPGGRDSRMRRGRGREGVARRAGFVGGGGEPVLRSEPWWASSLRNPPSLRLFVCLVFWLCRHWLGTWATRLGPVGEPVRAVDWFAVGNRTYGGLLSFVGMAMAPVSREWICGRRSGESAAGTRLARGRRVGVRRMNGGRSCDRFLCDRLIGDRSVGRQSRGGRRASDCGRRRRIRRACTGRRGGRIDGARRVVLARGQRSHAGGRDMASVATRRVATEALSSPVVRCRSSVRATVAAAVRRDRKE